MVPSVAVERMFINAIQLVSELSKTLHGFEDDE
jgi:hypothetical protein